MTCAMRCARPGRSGRPSVRAYANTRSRCAKARCAPRGSHAHCLSRLTKPPHGGAMAGCGHPKRGEEEFDLGIRNTRGLMMDRTVAEAVVKAKVGPTADVLKLGADFQAQGRGGRPRR